MERVFGNYLLGERIGTGGMGEVYRATKRGPEGFEVQVALKLILPNLAREESFRRMFSREARLAASLRHPNIVQVNGFDIFDGTPYIEMELVEGSDLASLLKTLGMENRLPFDEAAYLLYEAARGLAYAHAMRRGPGGGAGGIIHRDFNPHNILISVEGEVKIADFGIARAAMAGTAASGTLMGKLAYMSPEQIEGRHLDYRSDLFSLGTTAYQLVSGVHPFQRSGEAGTVRAIQEVSFQPLPTVIPDLASPVSGVIETLLAAAPEDRPDTAQAVAAVFEDYLKPAAVKRLGERIRGLSHGTTAFSPADPTAPTIPLKSRKLSLWISLASILSALVFFLILKAGGPRDVRKTPAGEPPGPATFSTPDRLTVPPQPFPEEEVLVSTVPAGARILSADSVLGLSPLSVRIPAGLPSRKLMVRLDGHEPSEVSLTRPPAGSGPTIELRPLPTGTLRIGAIPWARVTFMGKERGMTPLVIQDASVGTRRVLFANEKLGVTREVDIEVQKGDNPVFILDLTTGETVQGE